MKLNIELALSRIAKDYSEDRTFVKLPYELTIIKNNSKEWIENLEDDIINDRYAPGPIQICDVPKENHHIRPGAHLSITDSVYYTALVGEAYNPIYQSTLWARDRYDFSYALTGSGDKPKWVSDSFNEWKNFRTRSLEKIRQGYEYVLVADISGFYENINIQTLSYDLKQAGVANNIADALSKCLNHWAQNHGKGLPQGYTASNILAKLYLNSVDLRLKDDGFIHYRYVDDIRIFCKSFIEAKNTLIVLTSLMRSRGLNLQTSKTKILCGKKATDYIEGVQPVIENILADLRQEELDQQDRAKKQKETEKQKIEEVIEDNKAFVKFIDSLRIVTSNPYEYEPDVIPATALEIVPQGHIYIQPIEDGAEFTAFEVIKSDVQKEQKLEKDDTSIDTSSSDPETVDISIIKRTFESFFINSSKPHFDKTLFRFLLKRLSKVKDDFAVNYCKTLFERHPEETETLLKYFKNVGATQEAFKAIEIFLLSTDSIYHYQNYQIIEWMDTVDDVNPSDMIITLVRKWSFDNSKPYYLKSISRKYLTNFANASDLEMLEKLCIETRDAVEQAEMICIIQRLEKNRRNSTYARLGKSILNKLAVIHSKSLDPAAV